MPDGSPRDAYEWWRYDDIPADLKAYVETDILPRHEHYDAAHRPDHIRRVIARSMAMRPHPCRGEAVYAAAAMHDLGICEGREVHHLASGRIIRADQNLRRWFSEEEIELIAQAAEDHRASATTPPRSSLGMIVAEADRDIEPETIVRRTVEYGLGHYPELDREGHWQRTLDHLHEKYAEGGYIKLWMGDASPNAAPLADLRALIHDEPRLRRLFDDLFNQLTQNNLKP
ncbi:MAG: HD domain-containing protein [Bacteroidales bacterium]|nr:HD domain-containing protein [Bacteroidales bacterium]